MLTITKPRISRLVLLTSWVVVPAFGPRLTRVVGGGLVMAFRTRLRASLHGMSRLLRTVILTIYNASYSESSSLDSRIFLLGRHRG